MSDVNQILSRIEFGDPSASAELLPLVYEELRRLAGARLAQEKPGQTLQPTALVHEAYLRLVGGNGNNKWNSRGHFFGAAANAMRQILLNRSRDKNRKKRGGGGQKIDLNQINVAEDTPPECLEALDEALQQLEKHNASWAEVVKQRFFNGFSIQQTADALGIATSTAERRWSSARAWLYATLRQVADD